MIRFETPDENSFWVKRNCVTAITPSSEGRAMIWFGGPDGSMVVVTATPDEAHEMLQKSLQSAGKPVA